MAAANVNLPLGTLEGTEQSLMLEDNGQLKHADEYKNVIVTYRNGQPVWLSDLGLVEDGVKDERFSSWQNTEQSLTIAIKRQPGTNTIKIVDDIRAKLPWITSQMPASIKLDIVHDKSEFIQESVKDVKFTLELAVALVILVVFIFLRNLASTFIASVAIPFSIIATFIVMKSMDFTLDTFSLMALTLSVGFVGGRRHRHDRKYRAPPGNGQDAHAGRTRRGQRDRIHHHLHDPVPCHRVRAHHVHGGASSDACCTNSP